MTIERQGHVEKIGIGHLNKVELTLYVSGIGAIILEASKAEAEIYRPGMPVRLTVIPLPTEPEVPFESKLR